MRGTNRAFDLDDGGRSFQMIAQLRVGMLDRRRRLHAARDDLNIGARRFTQLLGNKAAVTIPWRRSAEWTRACIAHAFSQLLVDRSWSTRVDRAQSNDGLGENSVAVDGRHTLGLKPALESVDVLDAEMLGAVDLGCGFIEKLKEALQPIDVLAHGRADHGRRDLPKSRTESQRQTAWTQVNEINEG